jgi:hypothetical protein
MSVGGREVMGRDFFDEQKCHFSPLWFSASSLLIDTVHSLDFELLSAAWQWSILSISHISIST